MLTLVMKKSEKVTEDRVKGQREGVDDFIFKTRDEHKEFQEETQERR